MAENQKGTIDWGASVMLSPNTMKSEKLQRAMQIVYRSETSQLRNPTKERLLQIILEVGVDQILLNHGGGE